MPTKPGWWWRQDGDQREAVLVAHFEREARMEWWAGGPNPDRAIGWRPVTDDGRWLAPVLAHEAAEALRRERDGARAEVERLRKRGSRYDDVVAIHDDSINVAIWYPRGFGTEHTDWPPAVTIDLVDVRAADAIRVTYDFDRDGWRIEQDRNADNPDSAAAADGPEWIEMAFCPAWPFRQPEEGP